MSGSSKVPSAPPLADPISERPTRPPEYAYDFGGEAATVQGDIATFARLVEAADAGDAVAQANLEEYARRVNESSRPSPRPPSPRPSSPPSSQPHPFAPPSSQPHPSSAPPQPPSPRPPVSSRPSTPSDLVPASFQRAVVASPSFPELNAQRPRRSWIALLGVALACYALGFLTAMLAMQ